MNTFRDLPPAPTPTSGWDCLTAPKKNSFIPSKSPWRNFQTFFTQTSWDTNSKASWELDPLSFFASY